MYVWRGGKVFWVWGEGFWEGLVEVARRAWPRVGVIGEYGGRTGEAEREWDWDWECEVEFGDVVCEGEVSTVRPGILMLDLGLDLRGIVEQIGL